MSNFESYPHPITLDNLRHVIADMLRDGGSAKLEEAFEIVETIDASLGSKQPYQVVYWHGVWMTLHPLIVHARARRAKCRTKKLLKRVAPILLVLFAACGDNVPPTPDAAISTPELDAAVDAGLPYCSQAGCVHQGFCQGSQGPCSCTLEDGSVIECRPGSP